MTLNAFSWEYISLAMMASLRLPTRSKSMTRIANQTMCFSRVMLVGTPRKCFRIMSSSSSGSFGNDLKVESWVVICCVLAMVPSQAREFDMVALILS